MVHDSIGRGLWQHSFERYFDSLLNSPPFFGNRNGIGNHDDLPDGLTCAFYGELQQIAYHARVKDILRPHSWTCLGFFYDNRIYTVVE